MNGEILGKCHDLARDLKISALHSRPTLYK